MVSGPLPDPYLHDPVVPGSPACRCDHSLPVELDADAPARCLKCGLPSPRQVVRDQLARALSERLAA